MPKQIFFQSSLPRAGSTLLQNIIGQNPDFYVTPTSGVLELLYAARANYSSSPEFKAQDSELMRRGFQSFCVYALSGFFNGITNKLYVMDKSRGWGIHYGFLNSFCPEPKIVCMVRDPRAIYASMEKNYRKNPDKDPGFVNHSKMQNTTTQKRVETWSSTPPVGLAFERIQQMLHEGIGEKVLFVKFEDLTSNPQQTMDKIYGYLNIPTYQHDFDNVEQLTVEDDEVYGIYGDHNIRQKVEPVQNTYKEVLGSQTCNFIKSKYDWFFKEFRYI
jgi:sulfotransferase